MIAPVLYFAAVFAAACFSPGFSLVRQFASELGAAGAPHPWILNGGLVLMGLATMLSSVGFRSALARLNARPTPARWFVIVIALFGFAMIMAGIFPHPDWRHSGFGASFPILIGPALLAAALWDSGAHAKLRRYLLVNNVAMILLIVAFVAATRSPYVGLCQLLYSLAAIAWIGVAAAALARGEDVGSVEASSVS